MIRTTGWLLLCVMWANLALAADSTFKIEDIRIEGLQRISEGTVFNYLPLDKGDQLTPAKTRAAIRELYRTGFFKDIKFSRENNILVITLRERPAIAAINISGNKAIKEEDLKRVLFDIGLSEGEVFDRLVLDRLQQELIKQYFSQGRYAVTVDARVTELDRNRVRIAIVIDEGEVAKIRGHSAALEVLVQVRPVFPRKAFRRHREAALLLSGPRLCGLQRRIHAGFDQP